MSSAPPPPPAVPVQLFLEQVKAAFHLRAMLKMRPSAPGTAGQRDVEGGVRWDCAPGQLLVVALSAVPPEAENVGHA